MKSSRLKKIIAVTVATLTLTALSPIGASAAWKQDSNGWWNTEGDSYSTGWRSINGSWYYFDSVGYMKTGWVNDGGTWYYMQPSGEMKTGWINDGGTWYYMQPWGAMKTGWVNDGGTWYYMQSSGAMKTGWINYGGAWYFASSSGAMQTGVVKVDGKVYYLAANGAMATGSVTINGTTYTFDSTGAATGDKIPTTDKIFNGNGSAVTQGSQNPTDVIETESSGHHHGGGGSSSSYLSDLNDGGTHTGDYTIYNTSGTFGGSSEANTTTINGNISINASAVSGNTLILQNLKINSGKLTINFGEGNVILDNVVVDGVDVSNVGRNSLHVQGNSSIKDLNVSDANNDAHIVIDGKASIKNTAISSGAVLEGKFDNVSVKTSSPVAISGAISNIIVENAGASIDLESGSVGTVLIKGTATNTKFNIGSEVAVANLNVNAPTTVTGKGKIITANLGADTEMSIEPLTVGAIAGVKVTVEGVAMSPDKIKTITKVPTDLTEIEDDSAFQEDINSKYAAYAKVTINKANEESTDGKISFKVKFNEKVDNSKTGNDYVTQDILVTNADGTDKDIEYNNGEYTVPVNSIVYSTARVYRNGQVGYVTSVNTIK
ncbi:MULTISPECIES: hypothetical protein [Clostridium]|uniref:hypothetical protein n=1 Tax=Clostridium TaxID=1485 RepID=UPI001FA92B6F|nr:MULTISPECIES: hypothetical protein [Clostridium]